MKELSRNCGIRLSSENQRSLIIYSNGAPRAIHKNDVSAANKVIVQKNKQVSGSHWQLSKPICWEQKQERSEPNHYPSYLATCTERWCQWPAKTKTNWVFRRSSEIARVVGSSGCCRSSKSNQRYGKDDAIHEDQFHGSSKSSNIGNGIQLTINISCLRYTLWEVCQIRCRNKCSIQENTLILQFGTTFYEHRQICKCCYKRAEHFNSTWIHIRHRRRSGAKFNKVQQRENFLATERTMVAVYARSLQYMLRGNLIVTSWSFDRNNFQSRDKPETRSFASYAEE